MTGIEKIEDKKINPNSPTGRFKHGGRKKGVKNKRSNMTIVRLEELGCDPLERMVEIGNLAMEAKDYALAGSMFKELANYVAPKLKAIELSGPEGGAIQMLQLDKKEYAEVRETLLVVDDI